MMNVQSIAGRLQETAWSCSPNGRVAGIGDAAVGRWQRPRWADGKGRGGPMVKAAVGRWQRPRWADGKVRGGAGADRWR